MRNAVLSLPVAAQAAIALIVSMGGTGASHASDHLDTPTVIADPRADIGDLFAWTSSTGRQLNLVMTIVGHTFSDKLDYVFHIDSGKQIGATTATSAITCHFSAANAVDCRAGDADVARGDASKPAGLQGANGRMRVFAGLRDDPFFNNVKGTRAAYQVSAAALQHGARRDAAGCPGFDAATSQSILDQWKHTDAGPGTNFLVGWTPASLVIAVDLDVIAKGGSVLGVWAATATPQRQIDRAGRPLTGNALLGTIASEEESDRLKEQYNAATPATASQFIPEIEKGLALYDGFDGKCGNEFLAKAGAPSSNRYRTLAALLADDRLWVNSAATVCTQLFAVELANLAGHRELRNDCGGRTPNYSAVNTYRSLLVGGQSTGVDDGVNHDDHEHSTTQFPFLAAPDAK